jgi:hypothetical protein
MAVAALMPGRVASGDDGGLAGTVNSRHSRPAAARALRCIVAVKEELQVRHRTSHASSDHRVIKPQRGTSRATLNL